MKTGSARPRKNQPQLTTGSVRQTRVRASDNDAHGRDACRPVALGFGVEATRLIAKSYGRQPPSGGRSARGGRIVFRHFGEVLIRDQVHRVEARKHQKIEAEERSMVDSV